VAYARLAVSSASIGTFSNLHLVENPDSGTLAKAISFALA